VFLPPEMLLPFCLLKYLLQEEIAHCPSTGGKRSTCLYVSGSLSVILAPPPASELLLFAIRRLQLNHASKVKGVHPWQTDTMEAE